MTAVRAVHLAPLSTPLARAWQSFPRALRAWKLSPPNFHSTKFRLAHFTFIPWNSAGFVLLRLRSSSVCASASGFGSASATAVASSALLSSRLLLCSRLVFCSALVSSSVPLSSLPARRVQPRHIHPQDFYIHIMTKNVDKNLDSTGVS